MIVSFILVFIADSLSPIFSNASVNIVLSGSSCSVISGAAQPCSRQTRKIFGMPLPARSPISIRLNIFNETSSFILYYFPPGPIAPDSVLHMLHRVLDRTGLPEIRFHDLRHTFATLALQNGVDVKTVSGMLDHFSAWFTLDTYAHVTTAAQKRQRRPWERC